MAIEASLTINNKSYNILGLNYEISQPLDEAGKPAAQPVGGNVDFTIKSPGDEDMTFHEWMIKPLDLQSGKFELSIIGSDWSNTKRTIEFKDAYCIGLSEDFDFDDERNVLLKVKIHASELIFGAKTQVTLE
jgi:hypothetical protein